MSGTTTFQNRFIGLALFLGGVGLIYASLANFDLIRGASSVISYIWYFLGGIALVVASLLHAAGKSEGRAMKILVYTFIALSLPLLILVFVLP